MEYGPYAHRDPTADPKLPPLGVFVYEQAVRNERASDDGPAVYDKAVMLRIVIPGQKNSWPLYEIERTLPDGKVKIDKAVMARFRGVYDQWKENRSPAESGTPLELWPLIDITLVAAFKDANIYTVQQLAALSDGFMDNLRVPKAREWRAKAHAWISDSHDASRAAAQEARLAAQDAEIAQLKQMLADHLSAQNATLGFDKRARKRRAVGDDDDVQVAMPDDITDALDGGDRL